jgi:hypothetical protein
LVFEYSPPPIAKGLSPELADPIIKGLAVKDSCVANKSLINIAVDMGLMNSSMVNISGIAGQQMDALDFSSLSSGINLDNSIDLSNSPTSQLSALTNLDLTALQTTALVQMRTTTLINLKSQLDNLKLSLAALRGQSQAVIEAQLSYTPNNNPANAVKTAAVADLRTRILSVEGLIDSLTVANGVIDNIATSSIALEGDITTLRGTATTLKTTGGTIPPFYDDAIRGLTTFASQAKQNVNISNPAYRCGSKSENRHKGRNHC